MIKYQKNIDNVVVLTFDMKGQSTNIINHHLSKAFLPVLEKLESDLARRQLKGLIITSAKKKFLEGGDLGYLFEAERGGIADIYEQIEALKKIYRRLETLGVPVVAAINGSALGAGYELTLACHYRVAIRKPKMLIGLPEVNLGLIPGVGAISRLTWLLGIEKTLPILIEGRKVKPDTALSWGLLDELVEDEKSLIEQAKKWIDENPTTQQPWDKRNGVYEISDIKSRKIANWITVTAAQLMKKYRRNHPSVTAILDIMVNNISLDFDTANRIESRYFTQLICHPTARNMTKCFWFDLNKIKKGIARPRGFGRFRPRKIGVIGAGQMGSSIAALSSLVGLEIVLKDVSIPIAKRGKLRAQKVLEKQASFEITKKEVETALNLIKPTNDVKDFEDCDLVLEAVFENISVKTKVIREASNHMDEYSMFASNTSTLSISRLAKESTMPENFIGLKFFNPVETTRIVEIIRGVKTSDETVAKAIDFVRKIRKIPIVIQDRRGFFSTRVMEAYGIEGMALLKDGCSASIIEQTAINIGMTQGPLAMMDEISIANTLMFEERKMKFFQPFWYNKEVGVMQKMVKELKRPGKISQAGFYDYKDGEKRLWSELETHFHEETKDFSSQDIIERLLFVQSLEALRCLESGVINSVEEVNVASIYGWGYAAQKGGVLQYINDYGIEKFLNRTKKLAELYGARFAPPKILVEQVEKGIGF